MASHRERPIPSLLPRIEGNRRTLPVMKNIIDLVVVEVVATSIRSRTADLSIADRGTKTIGVNDGHTAGDGVVHMGVARGQKTNDDLTEGFLNP